MLRFFPPAVYEYVYVYNIIIRGRKRRRRGRRGRWQKRVCEQQSLVAMRDSAEGKQNKKNNNNIIFRVHIIV